MARMIPTKSKVGVTRESMIRAILEYEDPGDIDELDDELRELTLTQLREEYNSIMPKTSKTRTNNMPRTNYIAVAIRNPRNRTMDITIEDRDGKFLNDKGEWIERKPGEDVPVYTNMPEELFNAVQSASTE